MVLGTFLSIPGKTQSLLVVMKVEYHFLQEDNISDDIVRNVLRLHQALD